MVCVVSGGEEVTAVDRTSELGNLMHLLATPGVKKDTWTSVVLADSSDTAVDQTVATRWHVCRTPCRTLAAGAWRPLVSCCTVHAYAVVCFVC